MKCIYFYLNTRKIASEIFWPLGNHVQKLMILLKETSEAFCNFFLIPFVTAKHGHVICVQWGQNIFEFTLNYFYKVLWSPEGLKVQEQELKTFFNPLLVPVLSVTSWEKKVTLVLAPDFLSCMFMSRRIAQ